MTRCCCSRRSARTMRRLPDALKPLSGAIDVTLMREANLRANKGESPEVVAKWMAERLTR